MGTIKNWELLLNYNDVNLQIKLDFRNDVTCIHKHWRTQQRCGSLLLVGIVESGSNNFSEFLFSLL